MNTQIFWRRTCAKQYSELENLVRSCVLSNARLRRSEVLSKLVLWKLEKEPLSANQAYSGLHFEVVRRFRR